MAEPKVRVVIAGDASQLKRAFDEAEGETESFVGRVTGTLGKIGLLVGGAAAAIGGAVGGLVAKTGISFNDFQEQSVNAFTTMLGSAEEAQKFLQDLTSFAAKTPFELPGLVESSKLLLAFGFNAEQVIPMMTAIGDAVAGLGGGPEVMDGIVRALGQMQAKGKATAEEMMQLAERGVPAWQYLAEALGVSVSEAMDMVSDGAVDAQTAINAVIQGMQGDFSGLMEVQSRTWSGMLSTLKDTFTQFSGTVMAPVFERLKGGLAAVLEFVSRPEFMEFGKRLGEGIASAIDRVANLVQTVGVPAFQALVGAVREVVAGFQSGGGEGFFATLGGAIRSFVDTVQGAIPAVKQQLSDFFAALQGQEGESFGAKLGEGVKNTVDLIRNDVLPALKEFGNWFTSEGLPAVQNFANTVTPVIQPVFGFLKENLPTIVPLLATFAGAFVGLQGATTVLGGLLGPLTQVFSILRGAMSITPLISGLVGVLGGPLTAAILGIAAIVAVAFMAWQNNWFGIRDIVNQVWSTVGPILGQIVSAIGQFIGQVVASWQAWATQIAPLAQQAWQNIQTVVSTVASVVMTVVGAIAGFIASHWSQIQQVTSGVWNAVSAIIMGVMGVIQNVIKLVLALIAGDWGAAWEAMKGIVSSVFGAVVGVVDGILQALKGVITLALDGVKAVWSAVWGEIRDVAGRLLSEAKAKIVEGVEAIKGVFSGAATWLVEAGKDIVRGLIDGISSMIETAKQTARNLASGVKDAVFGFLGIESPSEVMQEAGQAVGEGLIAGLLAKLDAVAAAADRLAKVVEENAKPDLQAVAQHIGEQLTTVVQALSDAANVDEAVVERLQKLRDAVQVVQDVAQAAKDLAALDPDFSVASEVVEYLPYLAAQVATQVDEALRELELADIGDKTQRVRDALQTVRDTFGFVRDLLGIDPDEFMVAPELIEYLPYVAAAITEQLDQAVAQLSVENIAPRAQAIRDALGIVRDAVSAVRDLAEFTGGADIQVKVQELASALVGIVSGLASAVAQLGEEQLAALAETAQARLGPVIEFLDRAVEVVGKAQNELPNRIGAALENLAQALQTLVGPVFRQVGEQFGTSVGEGFLAGLAALEPAVLARAQALARAVQQVIARALRISSPSRVMMHLGRETALGFALGIHEVLRGIDRFVPLDDGEFLSALRPGTAASRSEGEQPVFRPEIRVYIGDRELRGIVRTELVEVLR